MQENSSSKKKCKYKTLWCASVCVFGKEKRCLEDTLGFSLVDGLVRQVGVLHCDGMRELIEHALLERLQTLVVMTTAHKLLILYNTHTYTHILVNTDTKWTSEILTVTSVMLQDVKMTHTRRKKGNFLP